jgi:hypothetical protein
MVFAAPCSSLFLAMSAFSSVQIISMYRIMPSFEWFHWYDGCEGGD